MNQHDHVCRICGNAAEIPDQRYSTCSLICRLHLRDEHDIYVPSDDPDIGNVIYKYFELREADW